MYDADYGLIFESLTLYLFESRFLKYKKKARVFVFTFLGFENVTFRTRIIGLLNTSLRISRWPILCITSNPEPNNIVMKPEPLGWLNVEILKAFNFLRFNVMRVLYGC